MVKIDGASRCKRTGEQSWSTRIADRAAIGGPGPH